MKTNITAIAALVLLSTGSATAFPKPKSYLGVVAELKGKTEIKKPVYVGPWVARPGAVEYRKKMTVASIIKSAGGVTDYPTLIIVLRPSKEKPDPGWKDSVYGCKLNRALPDAGASTCVFKLEPGDLVTPIKPPAAAGGII